MDAWWTGRPQIRLTRWIPPRPPWNGPHPRQHAFLWLSCDEAFYGGAAGGGKSDALLMAALQYVDVPNYAALIVRKTFAQLTKAGAIMDRSLDWLKNTDAKWNGNEHKWTFPSGATLEFGHLQTSNDKYNYQGPEFQFVGFDELTQFDEDDFIYLSSRLRKPSAGPLSQVPLRLRSASNPGGKGHRWVKRRYIERLPRPGDPEDTPEKCAGRIFIPAKVKDNPSIDQDAYRRSLSALDPQTRKQLEDGDWNARPPGDWVYPGEGLDAAEQRGRELDAAPRAEQPSGPVYLGIDWGVKTHMLLARRMPSGGLWVFREIVSDDTDLALVAGALVRVLKADGLRIDFERYDAAQPVLHKAFRRAFKTATGYSPKWLKIPFGKFKQLAIKYTQMLFRHAAEGLHLRTIAISPTHCPRLLEQLRDLEWADLDAGKVEKEDDHGPDGLLTLTAELADQFYSADDTAR
jgi:hypothetical protein